MMLKYPLSVFLDSNIFVSAKYDFSNKGILNTLLNFVNAGKIKIYISSIVKGEVEKHITDEVSKIYNSFKESRTLTFETVSENYLNQWGFSYLFNKPDKKQMLDELISAFEIFLQNTHAVILDCSDIDCDQIVSDYFAGTPPFANSDKKKFEFPDAIMVSKLKLVFNEKNSVYVISEDKKFREALYNYSGVKTVKSLKEVFDLINKEQKIYTSIVSFLSEDTIHLKLCKEIYNALDSKSLDIDGLDCDRKGCCDGFDFDEVYIDSIENVDFEFNSVDEITTEDVKITVTATASISATCTALDVDNSAWDSEEKEYVYSEWITVNETHEPQFECEFIFHINGESENGAVSFELMGVGFDLSLDQDTRTNRIIIPPSNPEEDALADAMDAMEEYYEH